MRLNINMYFFLTILFIVPSKLYAQELKWDAKSAKKWYNQKNWLKPSEDCVKVRYDSFGRIIAGGEEADIPNRSIAQKRAVSPHSSISVLDFAKQYHARKDWWTKVFDFIQYNDLDTLKAGKYKLDEDNVIYTVVEGPPRRIDTTKWESHLKYLDVHFIIKGQESVGITTGKNAVVTSGYDEKRDIIFYDAKGKYSAASEGALYIFFPKDLHRPNININNGDYVKKIVFKLKLFDN